MVGVAEVFGSILSLSLAVAVSGTLNKLDDADFRDHVAGALVAVTDRDRRFVRRIAVETRQLAEERSDGHGAKAMAELVALTDSAERRRGATSVDGAARRSPAMSRSNVPVREVPAGVEPFAAGRAQPQQPPPQQPPLGAGGALRPELPELAPDNAIVESSRTVSSCPTGQAAGSRDTLIGLLTSKVVRHSRQRNS